MKIINTSENRIAILKYLEQVDEDTFIDDFVIPLFRSQGYYLFRINDHGPGEHGKDLIFYRHIPVFYDNEYVVVQAKAEKIRVCPNLSKRFLCEIATYLSFSPCEQGQ